jgi:hypothetical protein
MLEMGWEYFPTFINNALFCFERADCLEGHLGIVFIHLYTGNRVEAIRGVNEIINLRECILLFLRLGTQSLGICICDDSSNNGDAGDALNLKLFLINYKVQYE